MAVLIAKEPGALKDVQEFERNLAGAELNVAVGLRRLGHEIVYVTKIGEDPFGSYIKEAIKEEGISDEGIEVDKNYLTGIYLKGKVWEGDPPIFYYRKNSAASHLQAEDIDRIDFKGADLLHISGISPALSESCKEAVYASIKKARKHNTMVSFDPNIRLPLWKSKDYMREVLNDIASRSDIVLPGIKEGRLLTGAEEPEKICDFYLQRGSRAVVVKTGPEGAFYKSKEGEKAMVPGFKVEQIVDTVGAGDGFAVGVLSGILNKSGYKEAVTRGNAIGAIVVESSGDSDNLPDERTLERFIKIHRDGI